jgi:hypothetical protein
VGKWGERKTSHDASHKTTITIHTHKTDTRHDTHLGDGARLHPATQDAVEGLGARGDVQHLLAALAHLCEGGREGGSCGGNE